MMNNIRPVGDVLREWRQRRRMSQLDLALDADISARHLSFMETGRSLPSRDMALRLAERLDMPLRERNALLVAAGYAPLFPERPLTDPQLEPARRAMELVLAGHEPYPALAIDRRWNMVAHNKAVPALLTGVDPALLKPPVNVLRLSLHPQGLAPRIVNYWEWRNHLFERLRRQASLTADAALDELIEELAAYPVPDHARDHARHGGNDYAGVVVPLQFDTGAGILSLIGTTTVFGTPVDITVSELALETFFPADAASAELLRELVSMHSSR